MVAYSRVLVDGSIGDLWFLGKPVEPSGAAIDARRFTACEPFGPVVEPLRLSIQRPGRVARLTFGPFDMPVVDQQLSDAFAAAADRDVELVSAIAEDGTELSIVNVLPCLECIDEANTVGEKWAESDGRADRVGMYRTIVHLVIDPSRVDHEIFRVAGWKIALIVSDRFADATGLAAVEGVRLLPVMGPPCRRALTSSTAIAEQSCDSVPRKSTGSLDRRGVSAMRLVRRTWIILTSLRPTVIIITWRETGGP
jgi:hypothetical protein